MPFSIPVSERLQNEREMGKKNYEATQIRELRCSITNQNKQMAGYKRGGFAPSQPLELPNVFVIEANFQGRLVSN